MKTETIIIKTIHPSLNQWAIQWDKFKRYSEKKAIEAEVYYSSLDVFRFQNEVDITIIYYMPSKRRYDPDNYSPKFYLDSLVKSGIIKDDSGKYVKSLTTIIEYDKKNPRAEITITENEIPS